MGAEKNQRTTAHKRTRRGMRWTACCADLRRERCLWATSERGSYVGRCWSVSMSKSKDGFLRQTLPLPLHDLCIG